MPKHLLIKIFVKNSIVSKPSGGRHGRDLYGSCIYNYLCNLVPITTEIESWNLDQGEVYSIQYYVIKFVSVCISMVFAGYSVFLHQ